MGKYNYFASPRDSPRAIAFRKAYGGAPLGQDFMFEDQPYARPGNPSLLAEEGAGTATGYVEKKFIPETDRAFMTPEMRARIAAKANEKRLGPRIGGRSKVLRDRPVWDHFEKRWVEPEGSFAQSQHGLDALEQDTINAKYASGPYNPPRFPAANQMGTAQIQHSPPSSVTGRYGESGGKGLLSEQSPPTLSRQGTIPYDEPDTNDKSGWEKSDRFNDAMAEMLLQWGLDQSKGQQWENWG